MRQLRFPALAALFLGSAGIAFAQQSEDTTTTPAAEITIADTIATVNGKDITVGDLVIVRRTLPEEYQSMPDAVLAEGLTQQLIDQALMADAAREDGMGDRPDVVLLLAAQARAILADTWMSAQIDARLTEDMIREAYDAQINAAEPVVEVRAAHILVDSLEKATELKAELDAGADFAELAAEHGTDGTKTRGGDLGYFVKTDMVPQFADAVFAMEVGTISDPVESPFGWHLIKLDDKRDRQPPPFDAMAPQIAGELRQQVATQVLTELRETATITRPETSPGAEGIRRDDLLEP